MGSGAGGYVRITLTTLLSDYKKDTERLRRVSELAFTGAPIPPRLPPPKFDEIPDGPPLPAVPAGKVGLGGVRVSEIDGFRLFARTHDDGLVDLGVKRDSRITSELCDSFGGRWAGYAVAGAPTGGRFRLVADITLKPPFKGKAQRPFLLIPVVMAFGTDRFVDHYLLAVIAAQPTIEQVETSVVQPYR